MLTELLKKKNAYQFLSLAVLLIAALNFFFNLWAFPVQRWDEARHGITAYEMVRSHDLILTTFDGKPDYWNSKPPLGFWLIAVANMAFGYDPFALRFFSALAGLLSVLFVMKITKLLFRDETASLFSGLILATTFQFVFFHGVRTGDFDSQLCFFTVLSVYFLIKYSRGPASKKSRYLYASAFVMSLTFLLKSFAVFYPVLTACIWWAISGSFKRIRVREYVIGILVFALPILTWGYFRYQADGLLFFETMVRNDLVERSTKALFGPASNLKLAEPLLMRFLPWSLLLIGLCFFWVKRFWKEILDRRILIAWIVSPLVIAALVRTKADWYIQPVFPALACLLGYFLSSLSKAEDVRKGFFLVIKKHVLAVFITLFFIGEAACFGMALFPEFRLNIDAVWGTFADYRAIRYRQELIFGLGKTRRGETLYFNAEAENNNQANFYIVKYMAGLEPARELSAAEFTKKTNGIAIYQNRPDTIVQFGKHKNVELVLSNGLWLAYRIKD